MSYKPLCRIPAFVALLALPGLHTSLLRAQPVPAPPNSPSFEVATIKPHNPDVPGFGIQIIGSRINTVNTSLIDLMSFAWCLHARQITGGPPWLATEKYDVVAEATSGNPQIRVMLQNLLADRFGLTLHPGNQKLPVYEITVAKGGEKLANYPGDPDGNPTYGFRALGVMTVTNGKVSDLAGWMQRYIVDRPVVDRTGISTRHTYTLNWRPDQFQFPDLAAQLPRPTDDAERPDLFTALRQQLGLTLESTKADVEVLVIDRVEKPSAN